MSEDMTPVSGYRRVQNGKVVDVAPYERKTSRRGSGMAVVVGTGAVVMGAPLGGVLAVGLVGAAVVTAAKNPEKTASATKALVRGAKLAATATKRRKNGPKRNKDEVTMADSPRLAELMKDEDCRAHYRATLDTLDGLTDEELDGLYDHAYEAEELVRQAKRQKALEARRARTLERVGKLAAILADEGEHAKAFYSRAFHAQPGDWMHAGGGGVWRTKTARRSDEKDEDDVNSVTELEGLFDLGEEAASIDPERGSGLLDWLDGLFGQPAAN